VQQEITFAPILTQYLFDQGIARLASGSRVTSFGNRFDRAQFSRSDLTLDGTLGDSKARANQRFISSPFFSYGIAKGLNG
jgi:hypothetical protein